MLCNLFDLSGDCTLLNLVLFDFPVVVQVVHCYRTSLPEVQQFPEQLINILKHHGPDMDPDMRMVIKLKNIIYEQYYAKLSYY